jgi:hypothetical protein
MLGTVMPVKFKGVVAKKNDVETQQTVTNPEGYAPAIKATDTFETDVEATICSFSPVKKNKLR